MMGSCAKFYLTFVSKRQFWWNNCLNLLANLHLTDHGVDSLVDGGAVEK